MNIMIGDYQLREAAGAYWLINMRQSGKEWIKPIRLNETGARLITGLAAGCSPETLAQKLTEEYGCTPEEALGDVQDFCAQLSANGICLGQMTE